MTDEEINYRTLRKIQQTEKNSPALSNIRSDFYKSLAEYLQELEQRYEKESSAQKKTLLKEEIENIKKISLSVYELREKKILLAAISKARGGNPDTNNVIDFENTLFKSVLNAMNSSRNTVFKKEETENEVVDDKENESDKIKAKKEDKDEKIEEHNPIVRVNKNMPEFIGTDQKKYYLRKNDIISMPQDMSATLSKRGVVERVDYLA